MLREHLAQSPGWGDRHFRWRGGDVSRIEGLSDAAFGVALALLIVSSSVPVTYADLVRTMRELPAFAACFAFLLVPWYAHYKFFRRFGIQDLCTVTLNGALLFVVLFYVYPLKFLFTSLFGMWFGLIPRDELQTRMQDVDSGLMLFYGGGMVLLFGLLAALNAYGYSKRRAFELNEVETFLIRAEIRYHAIYVGVALISIAMTLAGMHMAWAGLIYVLYGPLHFVQGWVSGRKLEQLVRSRS